MQRVQFNHNNQSLVDEDLSQLYSTKLNMALFFSLPLTFSVLVWLCAAAHYCVLWLFVLTLTLCQQYYWGVTTNKAPWNGKSTWLNLTKRHNSTSLNSQLTLVWSAIIFCKLWLHGNQVTGIANKKSWLAYCKCGVRYSGCLGQWTCSQTRLPRWPESPALRLFRN